MQSNPDKLNQCKQNSKREQYQQFWSQHRTTLISYETQFVLKTRPESSSEEEEIKRPKEYEGGFLFPGRPGDKDQSIPQLIQSSKYNNLRDLFDQRHVVHKQMLKLREFVKIMLELKHNSILKEFLQIYDMIIREIKEVKFESIRIEKDRFTVVQQIANKVTNFVIQCPHHFSIFTKYVKQNRKDTAQLFKVTAYCFLAQKSNFNINQYYSEAFDYQDQEAKIPKKKKKLEERYQ